MSVSIVVGGQYGSEGKGKVAQYLARELNAAAVVRVGGPNSGHTTFAAPGSSLVLRQLPTAAVLPEVQCVLPPGSYIDVERLCEEIHQTRISPDRLLIDPLATVVTDDDRAAERRARLANRIGSTGSGTGAAVAKRVHRRTVEDLAFAKRRLAPFLSQTAPFLRERLGRKERVIIEGTQGFGLSLLHSPHFPMATSRDTSAAGALSEAGLSPFDVDDVTLVIRSFPIRVAGHSGPFNAEELGWQQVAREGGYEADALAEYTTVTHRLRRVARFDPDIVRRAIAVNRPSRIVLNHVDYVDALAGLHLTAKARDHVADIARSIGQHIDLVGLGPDVLLTERVRAT